MGFDPKELALELLKEKTKRDKQVKIGASNASNPCTKCLAEDLMGVPKLPSAYWAGAVVGTAIHNMLDARVQKLHPEMDPEMNLVIGELAGYGEIRSTTDLYYDGQVNDWKTTTLKKSPALKEAWNTEPSDWDGHDLRNARYKVLSHKAQTHLYGRGVALMGRSVKNISIGYIPRDARTDSDIWGVVKPFDPAYAEAVWGRLEAIWRAVQAGRDLGTFAAHPDCFYCNVVREKED